MAQQTHLDGQDGAYDAALAYREQRQSPTNSSTHIQSRPYPTYEGTAAERRLPFSTAQYPSNGGLYDGAPQTPEAVDLAEPFVLGEHAAYNEGASPSASTNQAPREGDAVTRKTTLASKETRATGATSRSAMTLSQASWLPSRWAGAFLLTVIVEAVVVISMVGTVFARIQGHTRANNRVQDLKTVSVFFSLTIFGMVFIVLIALDANRLKNTIQVIGVTVFNIALLVTAALEISQVRKALRLQDESGAGVQCFDDPGAVCSGLNDLYPSVQKFLIVVPVIVGAAQVPLTALAFKLWTEWGWRVYKMIGADISIRRYYLCYQVLVVLLKFDFFFGIGFTMSYLILVVNRTDWEYGVTIAAVPLAILVLFLCGVYFIYKITRIYDPSTADLYRTVQLTLTFFSIFATLSLLLTLVNASLCLSNFGKGLRQAHDAIGHVGHRRQKTGDRKSIDGLPAQAPVMIEDGERRQTSVHFGAPNPSRLSLD